jgi:hypothetical protein
MADEPTLNLWADALLSKWGFGDGDMPDDVWDYLDEHGPLHVDWHAVLRLLVRRHLIPALEDAGHQIEVYDVETIHNPIRASKGDGVEVDYPSDDHIHLRLDGVRVSWEQIDQAIREVVK